VPADVKEQIKNGVTIKNGITLDGKVPLEEPRILPI